LEVVLLGLADRDEKVRREAIGMVQYGNILGTDTKDARKVIEKLLKDPVPGVAMSAAAALMQMSPKDKTIYLTFLIEGLQADKVEVREAAAQVLALSGPEAKAAVPALQKAVKDPADLVKVHAAMALTRITGEKEPYAGILTKLGRSSDLQVMMWAKLYQGFLLSDVEQKGNKR